jgi:hypothetical protein
MIVTSPKLSGCFTGTIFLILDWITRNKNQIVIDFDQLLHAVVAHNHFVIVLENAIKKA